MMIKDKASEGLNVYTTQRGVRAAFYTWPVLTSKNSLVYLIDVTMRPVEPLEAEPGETALAPCILST
jgi:hypothetical protein